MQGVHRCAEEVCWVTSVFACFSLMFFNHQTGGDSGILGSVILPEPLANTWGWGDAEPAGDSVLWERSGTFLPDPRGPEGESGCPQPA